MIYTFRKLLSQKIFPLKISEELCNLIQSVSFLFPFLHFFLSLLIKINKALSSTIGQTYLKLKFLLFIFIVINI